MKFIPIVIRNIVRSKRRTLLTVISIAISVFIFAALMSLPGLVDQVMRDRANSTRLICRSKAGFFYYLPGAYHNRIANVRHVEAVEGESIFMGTYRDPKDVIPSVAVDAEQAEEMWPDWGIKGDAARHFKRLRTGTLVGETLMRRFNWKVGDQIMLRGTIYPVDLTFTIVGTLSGTAPAMVLLFRRDYLDESIGRPGTVNLFWVKVDSSQSIPAVIAEVDEKFSNSSAETVTESEEGASRDQMGTMRVLLDGAKVLAAIVMAAIALVAANTAAMSVRERRREIAVMRAIGFTRGLMVAFIVGEGLMIGVASGVIGCGAAYVGLRFVPYASRSLGIIALLITLPKRILLESFAVAALIGIGSSLAPAIAAVRRNVVGELRAVV
jgi:putative ABC transport system permease protein